MHLHLYVCSSEFSKAASSESKSCCARSALPPSGLHARSMKSNMSTSIASSLLAFLRIASASSVFVTV